MGRLRRHVRSNLIGYLALFVALGGTGAYAADQIGSEDIAKNAVKSKHLKNGQLREADLKPSLRRQITNPGPDPVRFRFTDRVTATPGASYQLVTRLGQFETQSEDSLVRVRWDGVVAAGSQACMFQVRIDGAPDGQGGGEALVPNGGPASSLSAEAIFTGLPEGTQGVELWVRNPQFSGTSDTCSVNPTPYTDLGQAVIVQELR